MELMKKRSDAVFGVLLFLISMGFYLFFAFYDGAVICVDSPSYINMEISREPLYPMLLLLFRQVFSSAGEGYLQGVAIFQSILAACAALSLTCFLRKELKLGKAVSLVVLMIPLLTSLLCRFAAKRASMYSNSILTEGIATSLFLLFSRYLIDYCIKGKKKALFTAAFISFLLISTRKQMVITVLLLISAIVWRSIREKTVKKGLLILTVCVLGIGTGSYFLDCGYNYCVRGSFSGHTNDNRFLSTVVIYASEKEDGEAIKRDDTRELFESIYEICDEGGYLMHSAGQGWYERSAHFGDYYDCIQIDTLWPALEQYVREHYEGDNASLEKIVDDYNAQIIRALMPEVFPGLMRVFADNVLNGMVTTVAKKTPVLVWYSVVVYILYIVLLITHVKRNGLDGRAILAVYTLLAVMINVAVVSATIFCQTRYMIYNMPLFYISLILLCGSFSTKPAVCAGSKGMV